MCTQKYSAIVCLLDPMHTQAYRGI